MSQGALFTSPSTWRAHFTDDQEAELIGLASYDPCGTDALPAPPATNPESTEPIAEIAPKAKKRRTAKKDKLSIPAAPAGDESRPRHKPARKIHTEAPDTSDSTAGHDVSGVREGRVRKLTVGGVLLVQKKIADDAAAAKAKAKREGNKTVAKPKGGSSKKKK